MFIVKGCKSVTNRALILSAIAGSPSRLINPSLSLDSLCLVDSLNQLGQRIIKRNKYFEVTPCDFKKKGCCNVENAGTTLRFILSLLSTQYGEFEVKCGLQLAGRPLSQLIDLLNKNGAGIKLNELNESNESKRLRSYLVINKVGRVQHINVNFGKTVTSQYLSSILLISPLLQSLNVRFDKLMNSYSYVDLTLNVMKKFGIRIKNTNNTFISKRQNFDGITLRISSDIAAAAIFCASSFFVRRKVVFGYFTGDVKPAEFEIVRILRKLGFRVSISDNRVVSTPSHSLRALKIDAGNLPDTSLTLMVLAPFCEATTELRNLGNLKYKESNRLEAICVELGKIGVKVRSTSSSIVIHPSKRIKSGRLTTYSDHRLAMNFHLLKLANPDIKIDEMESVSKSYPTFFTEFDSLINQ